jgi:hypothetical protein
MASLEYMKACDALGLNELPESLNAEQIAKLHYPESHKSIERNWIENKIQVAIDSGIVQISSGEISKGDTTKTMQIIRLGSSIPKRPELELEKWIELFNGLDYGTGRAYSEHGELAVINERLINGWPSKWEVQTKTFIHQYSLIPLISSSHYKAWTDKPEQTEGSFLNGWLGISKQGNNKQEVNADAGKGSHAGTEPKPKALSKMQKQQAAILEAINAKEFKPMAIPDGEKGTIKNICEKENKDGLFNAETAFDAAWKKGIGKLWQMENHNSYAHRGNN